MVWVVRGLCRTPRKRHWPSTCPAGTHALLTENPHQQKNASRSLCQKSLLQPGGGGSSRCLPLQFEEIKIEPKLVSDLMRLPPKVSASAAEVRQQLPLTGEQHTCTQAGFIAGLRCCIQIITLEAVPSWPSKCEPHLFSIW